MQMIESFVRNPVKVTVGVILVALFGAIAAFRMPLQLTPEVSIPTLTIETTWPGASPQEVEREIVQEQEEQLKSVEGVTKMTSESMDSLGRITMEFAVGADMSEALLKVNTKLQQVPSYPENADEPVINTSNSSDRPIAWFILNQRTPGRAEFEAFLKKHPHLAGPLQPAINSQNQGLQMLRLRTLAKVHPEAAKLIPPEMDVTTLRRFAEDFIEARFERAAGVSNANVLGGREEEVQVVVDPERLAARQLTINDLRLALRGQNKDTSAGDFWEGKRRYIVRTLGQFRSPAQVENAIVARRNGVPVYVRDIATVHFGHKKPDGFVRRFGTSSIAINALRETGSNVLDVMQGLREANAELNAGILKQRGLELTQVYDETEYIHASIGFVTDNVVEGGVLTFIALLLFLRSVQSTVVIFVSILVSFVGMFLMMFLMGRTLNVPSLAGIAFAVGMLVDNFIVVLENIFRHHQQGASPLQATVRGTQEVWGAVLAATLSNLAVFIPVLFVQDQAGQLFRDIALAVSSALAMSLLVALIVVPTAVFRMLRPHVPASRGDGSGQLENAKHHGSLKAARRQIVKAVRGLAAVVAKLILRPLDAFGCAFVNVIVGINAWLQGGMLRRVILTLVFIGASVAVSYAIMPRLEYLPTGNRNLVFGILLPPPGYNLAQLTAMGQQVEDSLKPYWDVDPGSPEAAKLPYPVIGDFFFVARSRQVFLGIRAADPMRAAELVPLIQSVTSQLPGTFGVAKQTSLFEQGLTAGRTIDIEITGPELTKLVALGGRIFGQVRQIIPNAQAFPKPSLDLSNPELHVEPKWEHAADMGLTATELGYAVDALVDGAYATDYFSGGDKIDLRIVGHERFANRTQDVAALPVATPTGELVPLAAVATVKMGSGPEQINHRERQRAIAIEVTPPPEMPLETAMDLINANIVRPLQDGGELEGVYQVNLSGTTDKLRSTWQALRFNLLLALIITYLLMSALFESWLYPTVIILSVPLGAVGGFGGLWLLNQFTLQPLDVLTMLGFVILIGTVVNNPILIVEQALVHMHDEGLPQRQAILESVRTRIRPIFMTALIGLFGLLPLVISPGAGSELYRGLGSVVLGGLVVSTLFTLIFIPSLFSLALETKSWLARLLGLESPARLVLEPAGDATPVGAPSAGSASADLISLVTAAHGNGTAIGNENGNGNENGRSEVSVPESTDHAGIVS